MKKLFAIYKNGKHLGNQKGVNESEAIKKYLIDAQFNTLLKDKEFINQYKAIIAIEQVHFCKSKNISL